MSRVALVTGAGRGIGRATALLLAREGHRVMAVARSADELASLKQNAPSIETLALSLGYPDGCDEAIAATRDRLGPIEILVNNAGVGSTLSDSIFDQTDATWNETMAVNIRAPFFLTRAAAFDMREHGFGRIVMVSSTSGQAGSPNDVAYTTSKHALVGLMRATAQDVGTFGGTCNAVMPGWVYTEMAERSAALHGRRSGLSRDDIWAARDALHPRGKSLSPDEVAAVIGFLCSDAASGVNGETVSVDAGGAG